MLAFGLGIGEALLIASFLLSAATLLSKKKQEVASLDDAVNNSATQGAYVPLVIGRKSTGHVVAWVEDATTGDFGQLDGPGGTPGMGKGSGAAPPQEPIYEERALHILAVGPASEFREVRQNGEIIWEGLMTPDSHPSGTYVQCQTESTSFFRVYWGFPDDPVLPYIGTSLDHGIATRYPSCLKVLWDTKDLGQSRNWARLEYEFVCPAYSQIASSPSEIPRTGDDSEPRWDFLIAKGWYTDTGVANQGHPVSNYYTTSNNNSLVSRLPPAFERVWCGCHLFNDVERSFTTWGPAQSGSINTPIGTWGDVVFPVNSIVKVRVENSTPGATYPNTGLPFGGNVSLLGFTGDNQDKYFRVVQTERVSLQPNGVDTFKIWLGDEVDPALFISNENHTNTGVGGFPTVCYWPPVWISPVDSSGSDGINPIHAVDQLLFARYPYGSARDRNKFDILSIEVAAERLQAELIRGSVIVANGQSLDAVLASIMQDIGLMIPFNPETGKYTFRLLRYDEEGTVLDESVLLTLPEVETIRGDRPVDLIAFTFKDRDRSYRDVILRVADNGQITENDAVRSQKAKISITNDRDSVNRIGPRRGQEALGSLSTVQIEANHQTIKAVPGSRIILPSIEDTNVRFIVTDVKRDVDSSKVVINALLDTYDPPTDLQGSTFSVGVDFPEGDDGLPLKSPSLDSFFLFELPKALSSDQRTVEVVMGGVRRTSRTISARFWVSRDDTAFTVHGNAPIVASGTIRDELPAASAAVDLSSRTFDANYQLDIDAVEDLTLSEDSWRAGRQVLLIGNEIIYLKDASVTVIGNPCEGSMSGLIRGRAGTTPTTHAAGTPFFITLSHRLDAQRSDAFLPGKTIYFKAESLEVKRISGITDVPSQSIELTGKALTPITPSALRLGAFETAYETSVDPIRFVWGYHSSEFPRTGLGHQVCGAATGISKAGGHFIVKLYTAGEEPVYQTTTTDAFFDLTAALRATHSLDSGSPWTFAVQHVEGSFTSGEANISIQSI